MRNTGNALDDFSIFFNYQICIYKLCECLKFMANLLLVLLYQFTHSIDVL